MPKFPKKSPSNLKQIEKDLAKAIRYWNTSDYHDRYTKPTKIKQGRLNRIVCIWFLYGWRNESINIWFLFLQVSTCLDEKCENRVFCSSNYNYMAHECFKNLPAGLFFFWLPLVLLLFCFRVNFYLCLFLFSSHVPSRSRLLSPPYFHNSTTTFFIFLIINLYLFLHLGINISSKKYSYSLGVA